VILPEEAVLLEGVLEATCADAAMAGSRKMKRSNFFMINSKSGVSERKAGKMEGKNTSFAQEQAGEKVNGDLKNGKN
jgi:hypothetical protein